MSSFVIIQYTTVPVYQRSDMYRSLLTAHFSTAFGRVFQHLVFITTRGPIWMTHHLFGSVRVPSTVNQQDETITPATKANCHDNRSSALGCYPERTPHTPRRPDPSSQYAKETLSQPKYIQWLMAKLQNLPETWKYSIHTQPMMYTGSGSGIISLTLHWDALLMDWKHTAVTLRECMYRICVEEGGVSGGHICLTMCAGKCFA